MPIGYNDPNDVHNKLRGAAGRSWQSFLAMGPSRTPPASRPMLVDRMTANMDHDPETLLEIARQQAAVNASEASGDSAKKEGTIRGTPTKGVPFA